LDFDAGAASSSRGRQISSHKVVVPNVSYHAVAPPSSLVASNTTFVQPAVVSSLVSGVVRLEAPETQTPAASSVSFLDEDVDPFGHMEQGTFDGTDEPPETLQGCCPPPAESAPLSQAAKIAQLMKAAMEEV
jgi:hypothetical protein